MADILYKYKDSVYANITNKCNCSCTFCIRSLKDGVGSAETLWHEANPTKEEVIDAIRNYDFEGFEELVFCGYGEPTCALDTLLLAAKVPELSKVIDSVSISLNAPDTMKYQEVTRSRFDDGFSKMVDFATKCKGQIGEVKWSIVDVLPEKDIEKCKELSDKTGIQLRIRHFT